MKKFNKIEINTISYKNLIYSLYLTQLIMLLISFFIFLFLYKGSTRDILLFILPKDILFESIVAILFALLIISINICLSKYLPKNWLDDGGINEKLFANTPVWHIAIISIVVSFTEELLFRLFLQSFFGIIITSIIFTLIHFRYFNKIILISFTFLTSIFLGCIVLYVSWFAAFFAHALIDFVLGLVIRKNLFNIYNKSLV